MASKAARKSPAKGRKAGSARKKSPTAPAPEAEKAVDDFSAALKVFQKGDLARAMSLLKTVLQKYPEERELADRARTYLAVCERKLQPQSPRLREAEDYYNHGIFLLNEGELEEASRMFEKVLSLDPGSERALYAQACVHARSGEREKALEALRRAIEANPSNRVLASSDGDFEPLRDDAEFSALLRPRSGGEDV